MKLFILFILPIFLWADEANKHYSVKLENYFGLEKSYRVHIGNLELVIPSQIGPRILHFSLKGEENVFQVLKDQIQKKESPNWVNFGGHRLWRAPEDKILTYSSENSEVNLDFEKEFIRISKLDENSFLLKEIEIHPNTENSIRVAHRLTNQGKSKQKISAWALTVLPLEGKAILPLTQRGTHPEDLLPTDSIQIWAYTHLSDSIFQFKKDYIVVERKNNSSLPQKIGLSGESGWVAYRNGENLFIKKISYKKFRNYPDKNSSVEVFVNQKFLELETLSPLSTLKPNESIMHTETWILEKIPKDISTDDQLFEYIQTKLRQY